jgi:hypothetical protein
MMASLIAGALAMGYVVAGLFFLRFWRETHDRLFLAFAVSFGLLAVQRVALALVGGTPDAALPLYGLRALAFLLLIAAIIDKNRPARG